MLHCSKKVALTDLEKPVEISNICNIYVYVFHVTSGLSGLQTSGNRMPGMNYEDLCILKLFCLHEVQSLT